MTMKSPRRLGQLRVARVPPPRRRRRRRSRRTTTARCVRAWRYHRTMRGACADPSGDSASATSAATEGSASSHPSIEICASFVRQSTTATTGGRSHARRSEDSRPVRISACGHFGRTTRARSRCRRRSSVRLAAGEGGWGGVGVVVSSRERCYRDATCSRARGRGVRMDAVGSYRGCRRRRRRARAPMG